MPRFDNRGTRFIGVQGDNVCAVDLREEVVLRTATRRLMVVIMIVLMRARGVVVVIVRHTTFFFKAGELFFGAGDGM